MLSKVTTTSNLYQALPSLTGAQTDDQVIEIWLASKASTTQRTYLAAVAGFRQWVELPLREVKLEDLQGYVAALQQAGYKPSTVETKINSIKSLMSFACKVGFLGFNTGAAISAPQYKDGLAQRILSESEVWQLINAAEPGRDRLLLWLVYATGLRVSEVCGLTWSDLLARVEGGQATIYGKGSKTRAVLIPEKLWTELMAMKASSLGKSSAVFQSRTGRALEGSMVHRIVKAAALRAGLGDLVSCHWLRHSHATHALERGCPLHLLQASLGHSSLAVTGVYLHCRPDQGSSQYLAGLV